MATLSNCWDILRAFTTTLISKDFRGTRLIDEPNGKNVKDWVISNQAPKLVMVRVWGRLRD
jgi:hypothetical protein